MAKQDDDRNLDGIVKRIEAIERRLELPRASGVGRQRSITSGPRYCAVPTLPERVFGPDVSEERASLIRVMSTKWVNGTVLHFHFFQGTPWGGGGAQEDVVRNAFQMWKDLDIGLEFREVDNPADAEIRIGFKPGDGAWSYVGRDVLDRGANERTMNFGWNIADDPDEIDTALHEIGHSLGFPHEHQNPHAGIIWDEEAVYVALAAPPNSWSRDQTFWNIIRKIPSDTVEGTDWDPDSIMHYPFGPGLIKQPEQYRQGLQPAGGLSAHDRAQVKLFYPPMEKRPKQLEPFHSEMLKIEAGEQKDFAIVPDSSRDYDIRTFGASDTVIVLFEEIDGELRYVKGDDDSGTDRNAHLHLRLVKDRHYVLRIRLYYQMQSGYTAVMYW